MNARAVLSGLGQVDEKYIMAYEPIVSKKQVWCKKEVNLSRRLIVIAASVVAIACVIQMIHHFAKRQTQHIVFNEATSVTYSAPLYGISTSEEVSYDYVAQKLGYDIISLMPADIQTYDYKCARILSEEGTLIGLSLEGYKDRKVYQSPGIYVVITFGEEKPVVDYSYSGQKVSNAVITGFSVQACVIPEYTITSASGKVKTIPSLYSASIDTNHVYYYFESRGKLTEKEMETVILSIVYALNKQ